MEQMGSPDKPGVSFFDSIEIDKSIPAPNN